jgi:WD40 repeat protein
MNRRSMVLIPAVVLLSAACGSDHGSTQPTETSAARTTVVETTGSAGDQRESTYATNAFAPPFDVTVPSWLPAAPTVDESNFVTWEAPDGVRAVRFLVPVNVYPPGSDATILPPQDYLAYLLSQTDHGASFTDVSKTTVGGRPATLVTATTTKSLDGSLGCQKEQMTAAACFGLQPDFVLRIAVVDVGDKTVLIWLRNKAGVDETTELESFNQMLGSVQFSDRAVVATSVSPSSSPSTEAGLAEVSGQLVFDHDDGRGLTLWTVKDGVEQPLFPAVVVEQEYSDWSPDGGRLVFGELLNTGPKIFVSDLHSPPRELATGCAAPCGEDGFAAFSPDGQQLAFRRIYGTNAPESSGIGIVDATGGDATMLTQVPWSQYEDLFPRWSPDGQSIVFARHEHDASGNVTGSSLYVLTVATGALSQLTPPGLSASTPDWSSSGLIVFAPALDEVGVARDVSVIAPDGSGLRNLTAQSVVAGAAVTPRWTADGAHILFSHRTSNGDGAIWIMNADGTDPLPLTHPSKSQIYPTLSPT